MEQIIIGWIQTHIATVATWIVGIGAIGITIKKYGPKVRKWIKIIREVGDVLDSAVDALSDNPVKDEKIKIVLKEIQDFRDAIK